MNCPIDGENLEKVLFHNVEVDYCPTCLGMWFDKDELEYAEHDADKDIKWLDIDLWKETKKFSVSKSDRHCPVDRVGLQDVHYGDSKTKVSFCEKCGGIWLDRGGFKQIINYLKQKSDYDILHHYTKTLVLQLWEVFAGPKPFRDELEDFIKVVKLFKYKFVTQHPYLEKLIEDLPK